MVYVTGDTHGTETSKLHRWNPSSPDDCLIILGDFGGVWFSSADHPKEKKIMEDFNSLPYQVLFLDGNHENFTRLNQYLYATKWGGKVQRISDNVWHLCRGQVFTFEDSSVFVLGGAASVDKDLRTPYLSWWPQENVSEEEKEEALFNLKQHDFKVDFILTHTCPSSVNSLLYGTPSTDPTAQFLDKIYEQTTFHRWFFGHHHIDKCLNLSMIALYNSILPLL